MYTSVGKEAFESVGAKLLEYFLLHRLFSDIELFIAESTTSRSSQLAAITTETILAVSIASWRPASLHFH